MISKEEAYLRIEELVTRFGEQIDDYKRSDYNETLTRRDFLDPFFKALGWDVDNSQGFAEAYREVIHEDRVRIGKATKAPDYSFRLPGGKRLFFVEAKKPSVVVRLDTSVAYQIRRYGWSARLAVSIITDFEEFAVYDCTVKPQSSDSASVARIKYLRFTEYLKEFDFLWDTFSKERVLKGSFDRYIGNDSVKKGTTTVDKAFLASLDAWRTYLATNISLRNRELDEDEINYAVQLTIDRLIFLRIAEDREIEPYGQLRASVNQKGELWQNLFYNFRNADEKYNSGLFDLKKDLITPGLAVDNKVIKTIVNEMYYPDCPYEFSVFSVEILGSAYEQFLGKVIRIDQAHRAKIEEKPEVRKAGGVYYTPQYIVDYIVKNTVGKLTEGRTPAEISNLRIVDPACGSGSFLLGAYQYLLDVHKQYYADHGVKTGKKESPVNPDGSLTSAEKKRILLNNIYGVDIDVNAVEVTKLSLLLKCLEGETETSIARQQQLWHERILPTLDNNIKSGNSLIDIDFYSTQLDFGEEKKIKPFNWQKAFPEVFQKGGFDAVIGNPPYIRIQSLVENSPSQGDYFNRKYKSASKGNYDLYVIFIEHALNILNQSGMAGFILPHKFFTAQYGEGIRQVLISKNVIDEIIHFGHQQIFENATTYTCILTLSNQHANDEFSYARIDDLGKWKNSEKKIVSLLSVHDLTKNEWNFISETERELFNKLSCIDNDLESTTERIFQGLKTGADKIFILEEIEECDTYFIVYSPQLNKEIKIEKELLHRLAKGGNSKRFHFTISKLMVLFPYKNMDKGRFTLIPETDLIEKYPLTFEYLKNNKKALYARDNGKINPLMWHGYSRNQALDVITTKKIFTPDISPSASYSIDLTGEIFFTGGVSGGYGIIPKSTISEKYLLGLLNSKVLDWYLKRISTQMRGGWYSFESKYIKHLPIKIIDPIVRYESDRQKEIEYLVDQLLLLNSEKAVTKLESKIEQLQGKIDFCEDRINQLVYALYGLTAEEIAMVEGSVGKSIKTCSLMKHEVPPSGRDDEVVR